MTRCWPLISPVIPNGIKRDEREKYCELLPKCLQSKLSSFAKDSPADPDDS
jgi:hypothetical protein